MSRPWFEPEHPCRVMPTRGCPPSYGAVCGDRPCARFESDDVLPWGTAEELLRLVSLATEREQCTVHATREEHADPETSPPPEAMARWVGRNGYPSLLCRTCLAAWLDNAIEDPEALAPISVDLFLWRSCRT